MNDHLFICGMMGSGKTTVGRLLAKRLELPFIDTDRWIQGITQQTIAELFKEKGEVYFRQLEFDAISELTRNTRTVISLGGGSLSQPESLSLVHQLGLLIYLDSSIDWLYGFIKNDQRRPMLLDEHGRISGERETKERLRSLFEKRRLAYETATIHIKTDQKNIDDLVTEIYYQL